MLDLDYIYFFYVPLIASGLLATLRRMRLRWWVAISFASLLASVFTELAIIGHGRWQPQSWLAVVLFGVLPVCLMCTIPRMRLFQRWPVLILIAGPACYWTGFGIGINIWLGLGFPH